VEYSDALELRENVRRGKRLADAYRIGRDAEDRSDWGTALASYRDILDSDPGYRDTADRKQNCETRQRVADLQSELRIHAAAERWQAVMDANSEIRQLDPEAADPERLATHASETLRQAKDQDRRQAKGSHEPPVEPAEPRSQPPPPTFEHARELTRLTHEDRVSDVAFSPDGTRIATASGDKTARVWEIASGRELPRLTHEGWVFSVAVSPDGARIATAWSVLKETETQRTGFFGGVKTQKKKHWDGYATVWGDE
jgi:hypothetical protein